MAAVVRQLVAAIALFGAASGAFAQTLACNPALPRLDPGAGFAAFGTSEQALARAGNAGAAWEWALGTDTDGTTKTQGSADWKSGRQLTWTLSYSGGAASLVVLDGATTLLSLDYPSGMDAGNALELRATMNSSIGADTSMLAGLSKVNDKAAAGAFSLVGSNQTASQALYFYYPPMTEGFSAQGSMMLTYPSLPTGSRLSFTIKAGMLPCTNKAPSVSLASPLAGSILQAGSTVTLSADAADVDGSVAQVEFFANGVLVGSASAAPFSVQWTPQPGNYVLTAVATDNAGDRTTSSQAAIIANAQPTVSITAPAAGTILQLPGAVTLTAGAADSDGTVSKVDFYQGATLLGTATSEPYSFSLAGLPPGAYSFSAVATDDRGGTGSSMVVPVVVNAPPSVSLTISNTSFKAPANISLAATAVDGDGTIANVAFYYGDTLITTLTSPPYAFTWTGVPQGTYPVTARVTDNTGYVVGSDPITVTVMAGVAKLYFVSVDHLNTPRLISNDSGVVVWRWDQQEPFGDIAADDDPSGLGSFDFPLRLPGQYIDQETNLHYNYFRDYDPTLGRYYQSDPIGLDGGPNIYAYVYSPLTEIDPNGLMGRAPGVAKIGGVPAKTVKSLKERPASCGPDGGFWEPFIPNNPLTFSFLPCCVAHDRCYDKCQGPDQLTCDTYGCACFFEKCRRYGGSVQGACLWTAQQYCHAIVYSKTAGAQFSKARATCAGACRPR